MLRCLLSSTDALSKEIDALILKSDIGARAPERRLLEEPVHVILRAVDESPVKYVVHEGFRAISGVKIAQHDLATRPQLTVYVVEQGDDELVVKVVD